MDPVVHCPSVATGVGPGTFIHQPCTLSRCVFWKGRCTAADDVEDVFGHKVADQMPPPCDLAFKCRWHLQAAKEGRGTCLVRRLGMVCEHQGGEWNTFEMADPDEWDSDPSELEKTNVVET